MNKEKFECSASMLLKYVNCHTDGPIHKLRDSLTPDLDGFRLDVQSARDGVCVVTHSDSSSCLTCNDSLKRGVVKEIVGSSLRLIDALELPFKIVNIELIGEGVWKQALAAVEASGVLSRSIFSSFEHSEILQLWSACHEARCGLSWEDDETANLNHEMLSNLPDDLKICISMKAAKTRRDFWEPYRSRLIIWGAATPTEAQLLGFNPCVLTVDRTY